MGKNVIDLQSVNDLLGRRFYIPVQLEDYRRTEQQVTELLDSLWDKKRLDSSQAIRVKERCGNNVEWEVVKGSEQLASISVLLSCLPDFFKMLGKESFDIKYETRHDIEVFLTNIDLHKENDNLDYNHICRTYKTIHQWLKDKDDTEIYDFLTDILAIDNVQNSDNLISLTDYLEKDKTFIIPIYQRGYVWGKDNKSDKNSVEFILETIKDGFSKGQDVFLQGMTASETKANIELIDGQQRTTFFYLLLCYLGYDKDINIEYSIRKESEDFLIALKGKDRETILTMSSNSIEEPYQDLFFFKKTLRHIHQELKGFDSEKLQSYILEQIFFLYIDIPKEKAIKTFTMMNGSKAVMLPEELIKAEMLRQISVIPDDNERSFAKEWETNALRSRYAREWDKWLYWWNREDVKYFFKTENPMGLLLEYYYLNVANDKKYNFENFKALLSNKKQTKIHFRGLRNLQKSFEDIFKKAKVFNYLGISLKDSNRDERHKIINFFIVHKNDEVKLLDFAKWRVVGATFRQITFEPNELTEKEDKKEDKAQIVLDNLSQRTVYNSDGDSFARKYLLFLNILADNKTHNKDGRKFNFRIFDEQSLEHIHPQSKVCDEVDKQDKNNSEWLARIQFPENLSEHSIGNLVLLECSDNSKLSNKSFNEKKNIYFDLGVDFKSRELLHSISVFAKEKWDMDAIIENQNKIISRFENDYGVKSIIKTHNNE